MLAFAIVSSTNSRVTLLFTLVRVAVEEVVENLGGFLVAYILLPSDDFSVIAISLKCVRSKITKDSCLFREKAHV